MKLQQLVIPEPSKLYSLKPEGIGTFRVESLASYAMRLAEAHCMDVSDLIHRFIHPLIGNQWKDVRARRGVNKFYKVHRHSVTPAHLHHGKWLTMTEETQATVTALSELTKRQDLHLLTLLPLSGYVKQESILRYQRAWCPCCYEEQKDIGRAVYDLMLWSFRDVVVCPEHRQILWSACTWCGAKQYHLGYKSQPGYCSKCGLWLGSSEKNRFRVTPYDLWKAEVLGDLLADLKSLHPRQLRTPPTIQQLLSDQCDQHRSIGRIEDLLTSRY